MSNSSNCSEPDLKPYYAVTYTVILIPGLTGNTLALWVFYGYMKETKRAVIFMINLAIADLLQMLSLPLRIFPYLTGTWEFGGGLCMLCFYLKYVNMYASIYFLVCISVRRYLFFMHPFKFSDCRRVCDVYISIMGWVMVCVGCLPFPLLRMQHQGDKNACFVDLPIKKFDLPTPIMLITIGELVGFVTSLLIILYCSWKTILSLKERHSASWDLSEKKKALKMILTCALVFLICFAPYPISFPLDFFVKTRQIREGCMQILVFHAMALGLTSLNSCVDPVIYYFTTDEFRGCLSRQDLQDSIQLSVSTLVLPFPNFGSAPSHGTSNLHSTPEAAWRIPTRLYSLACLGQRQHLASVILGWDILQVDHLAHFTLTADIQLYFLLGGPPSPRMG